MPSCPSCTSEHTVKNGHIHTGKQRFLCRDCGYQFVENPTDKRIDSATRALIDRKRQIWLAKFHPIALETLFSHLACA